MLGKMTRRHAGFTVVELLIVGAVLAIIVTVAAPSFSKMLQMQRLRSANAQVVTDMQFGRAEAVARRDFLRVVFNSNATLTCYVLFTAPDNTRRCDCLLGPGTACAGSAVEIRTVQVLRSTGVTVEPPASQIQAFAFDWRTGGIYTIPTDNEPRPIAQFLIGAYLDPARKLYTRLNQAGRPLVCTPAGSTMSEPTCLNGI